MKANKITLALLCSAALTIGSSYAEANTSGVHGPNVNPNDRSMQLRLALSPGDESGQEDNLGYRLHYQHALNDRWRVRGIIQYRDRGDFQYDYLRAEALYNFKKKQGNELWSSGVRFDIRTRRGDRPEQFSVNWTNQWELKDNWRIRGIAIVDREFGSDRAASGLLFETRSSISKKLDNGLRVGVEMFNEYGKLGDFDDFNDQTHQIGPMIGSSWGDGFKWEARYLAGVTAAGRDHNFGFRINKSF